MEGLPERAGNARGRAAEVERVRSQQPAGPGELKERYGKNIPLEETVVSPQAVFDAPQLTTVASAAAVFVVMDDGKNNSRRSLFVAL